MQLVAMTLVWVVRTAYLAVSYSPTLPPSPTPACHPTPHSPTYTHNCVNTPPHPPTPVPPTQDVEEALRRLPQQEILNRNARLKRALDLSLKGTFLPKELQEVQTPLDFYLKVRAAAAAASGS
jgi:hypothetical protein